MKISHAVVFSLAAVLALIHAASTGDLIREPDISLQHETDHAITLGLRWLQSNQNSNGWWSTPDQPAVTALALTAFMGSPSSRPADTVARGYSFILTNVKPDGAIYGAGLANYNTSLCMMGLLAARDPKYDQILRHARHWLITQQTPDGGVGYGDHGDRSDMNNTFTALEALYYSKYLDRDQPLSEARDLNWEAAIKFIQSCQNFAASNPAPWVSTDPKDAGGFVYEPGNSKAGGRTNYLGRVALRSYGSISYAGMLSYIYADLKPSDPRVLAVYDWLRNNYTVDENPAMGQQGLYYYLHLMARALVTYNVDQLPLSGGQTADWRRDLALKLINLQKADGSWANPNGRWWEHDPALVTSYSVLTLELISPRL